MTINESPEDTLQLGEEIERIRAQYPYQNGYRDQIRALIEVMFFRFGQRPGANRLVSLLAQNGTSPSTSTAQDEINKFWNRIRETAKVKIDRPDLPALLLDHLSEMGAEIWQSAMTQAEALTADVRRDAQAESLRLRDELFSLQEQTDRLRLHASAVEESLQRSEKEREELASAFAGERAARMSAEESVRQWQAELQRANEQHQAQEQRSTDAIHAAQLQLERLEAEQRRQLSLVDDFKQAAARDRLALEGAERRLEDTNQKLAVALRAVKDAEFESNRIAGHAAQVAEQLAGMRQERDEHLQKAISATSLASALTARLDDSKAALAAVKQSIQRAAMQRSRAVKRAWRVRALSRRS